MSKVAEYHLRRSCAQPTFAKKQELARNILQDYYNEIHLGSIQHVNRPVPSVNNVKLGILAPHFKEEDTKPVGATGDGNCLFNAASIAIFGSEKMSHELRRRTFIELALNRAFADHPVINEVNMPTRSGRGKYSEVAIYDDVILGDNSSRKLATTSFQVAIEEEIGNTKRSGCFYGLLHIMGLASSTGCHIGMIYPDSWHILFPFLNHT